MSVPALRALARTRTGGPRQLNPLAVLSVSLLAVPPAAVVVSLLARRQIRRTGEDGYGLATAALWVGGALVVMGLLAVVAVIGAVLGMAALLGLVSAVLADGGR